MTRQGLRVLRAIPNGRGPNPFMAFLIQHTTHIPMVKIDSLPCSRCLFVQLEPASHLISAAHWQHTHRVPCSVRHEFELTTSLDPSSPSPVGCGRGMYGAVAAA